MARPRRRRVYSLFMCAERVEPAVELGGRFGSRVAGEAREVPLHRLRPWDGNPRRISPDRFEDLKRALTADPEMLWARPLIALLDGTVIGGNQRLLAAQELGWRSIPALFVDLDPERARLWALRDNSPYGEWDEPVLAELLAELGEGGVELALTGFASSDLDRILAGLTVGKDPDEAPPLPVGEPESRLGEVYELGPHRVMCGDATDPGQVRGLLAGEQAELVWTDPPYGVGYVGRTASELTIDNDDADGLPELLQVAFAAADGVLAPSGRFYVASPAGPQGTVFRLAIRKVGWQLHQTLVWVKNSLVVGHCDYHYQHEDVLYGWKPGPGRAGRGRHKGSRWQGGNDRASVFFVDRPARNAVHPTSKPVGLITAQLRNSTRRGDLVLDPFAGSGSTLIACELLGRRCRAIEIDPAYVDVIRRRYREFVDG
jgi:DNA modification methylase